MSISEAARLQALTRLQEMFTKINDLYLIQVVPDNRRRWKTTKSILRGKSTKGKVGKKLIVNDIMK